MLYAIVTGASKGIGKAILYELAKRGYNLIIVARSESLLVDLKNDLESRFKIKVVTIMADLSQSNGAQLVYDVCIRDNYEVCVLINNAGYGLWGRFESLNIQDQRNLIQLNILALVELTHLILPLLKKSKQAYIVNVSSTAAYQAVPCLSIYAASKAFVLQFSRGLRFELRKSNVSVSCVSPGATKTGFIARAGMQALEATADKFSMLPEAVALAAIDGMFDKKAEIIPGLINKLSAGSASFLPKLWLEKAAALIYEKWLDKN